MDAVRGAPLAQAPKSWPRYINTVTIQASPEQMGGYFDYLSRTVEHHPGFYIRFGRHVLKLTFPTQEYAERYAASLQLVKTEPTEHPDGSIHIWIGEIMDYLPMKDKLQPELQWVYNGEAGFLEGWRYNGRLTAYDYRTNAQYVLIRQEPERYSPPWHPFRFEFHNFARRNGYLFLHSAAVGMGERGVLLSAAGGSGKSTTVLGSLLNGGSYVSDDYIIWDTASGRGYPLYSCGILNTDSLQRLPELKEHITGWVPNRENRAILDLRSFADQFVFGMELRAIIRPSIPAPDSHHKPQILPDPMESGKMQLAVSTARQNGYDLLKKEPGFLNQIMAALRELPCYEFRLSRDPRENTQLLKAFIEKL